MKFASIIAAAVATASMAAPALADKLDDIIASGKLRCAVVLDFPPMGSRDAQSAGMGRVESERRAVAG